MRIVRAALIVLLTLSAGSGVAWADAVCEDECTNQQDGDNEGSVGGSGASSSGDAVGGQVTGVVSSGDASVDARNRSEKVDIETGAAAARNSGASFVGLNDSDEMTVEASDAITGEAENQQDGDNELALAQSADASSGDGVGGQVIGAVTSAGGSADIVADNASKKIDITTGDASADNWAAAFVGLNDSEFALVSGGGETQDAIAERTADNQQDGDNTITADQAASSSSGDGVGGQVIGVVSAGDASIDARNRSEKIDVDTGHAIADNQASSFVGHADTDLTVVFAADAIADDSNNQQDGDNTFDLAQTSDSESGDGVGGQVIGAVTSAGGSADIVADNASKKVDIDTGEANAGSTARSFVGQNNSDELFVAPDDAIIFGSFVENQQDGDNTYDLAQTADASSGDGVGGQVIGVVSAGDASVDARNRSEKVDANTGDALADNDASAFVGLNNSDISIVVADAIAGNAQNQQDGDNDADISQSADAASGDGVGGQVIGAVTSAGGSADIVADNASKKVDADTGDADADNEAAAFVGLDFTEDVTVVAADAISQGNQLRNQQDGDNALTLGQSADATTGDGVGGQVLGVVSAGDASIDAKNASEKIDAETGNATADNDAAAFVGLNTVDEGSTVIETDAEAATAFNQQDGDNEASLDQTADASSGDAVGGQVAGVVTSAGGAVDAVLDNSSKKIDGETGPSEFDNDERLFVGLNFSEDDLFIGPPTKG